MSNLRAVIQITIPVTKISAPNKHIDWPGTSDNEDIIKMVIKSIKDSNARVGSVGTDNIFERLIDTPTKISPVKVAAAPAVATKKFSQSFMKQTFRAKDCRVQKLRIKMKKF